MNHLKVPHIVCYSLNEYWSSIFGWGWVLLYNPIPVVRVQWVQCERESKKSGMFSSKAAWLGSCIMHRYVPFSCLHVGKIVKKNKNNGVCISFLILLSSVVGWNKMMATDICKFALFNNSYWTFRKAHRCKIKMRIKEKLSFIWHLIPSALDLETYFSINATLAHWKWGVRICMYLQWLIDDKRGNRKKPMKVFSNLPISVFPLKSFKLLI